MAYLTSESQIHAHPLMQSVVRVIGLVVVFFLGISAYSQPLSSSDKTAVKSFYKAYDLYQAKQLDPALREITRALERDPRFIEAYLLRGDIFAENDQIPKAIESYNEAIRYSNPVNPRLYFVVGQMQLSIGLYTDAAGNFQRYLESPGLPDKNQIVAERMFKNARFGELSVKNPVPFQPKNLGDSINTETDEFINGITADGEQLFFTRWIPRQSSNSVEKQEYNEDFFQSILINKEWCKARNLGTPINTSLNEGALSISPDGNHIFFAACHRDDGFGSCDLYRSTRLANGWSPPENLGEVVNSPQWDSQPSFSSDGKTLYFASKRPGGRGSSDIWKTELNADGTWSAPRNLGDTINTALEEMAPFIHPDDHTLYFSSKGHPGMGGMDLFLSRKGSTTWNIPQNLGYPINTFSDEVTLIVNTRGDLAYISSDKLGGKGKQDIYEFPLYPDIRPAATTYFKGIVYDEANRQRLGARFELTDLKTQKVVAQSNSNAYTGEFLLVLPTDRNYSLNVSKPGYLFFSDNFMLSGVSTIEKPFVKDVPLKAIRIGEGVILKNIFFDTDQYTLKEESRVELNKLLLLLQQNPKLRIEISGHTDRVGSEQHNIVLSENRARAVYEFLLNERIAADRMTYKGYGFSKPLESNETEAGRAVNRRTEFKVIGE